MHDTTLISLHISIALTLRLYSLSFLSSYLEPLEPLTTILKDHCNSLYVVESSVFHPTFKVGNDIRQSSRILKSISSLLDSTNERDNSLVSKVTRLGSRRLHSSSRIICIPRRTH